LARQEKNRILFFSGAKKILDGEIKKSVCLNTPAAFPREKFRELTGLDETRIFPAVWKLQRGQFAGGRMKLQQNQIANWHQKLLPGAKYPSR
jgi:hypothetical protein